MLTEVTQFIITIIVLLGGGYMLFHGGLDADTAGMIKGLMLSWSGFWLGAKVQRNIPTSTTTKVGPAESTTITGDQHGK
jgi:hypothetical protein